MLQCIRVNVNMGFAELVSPFSFACELGLTDLVALMLKDPRIDTNCLDIEGCTPFLVASMNGLAEVVWLLLEDDRIDVNRPNSLHSSPLWLAAQNGHLMVVQLLLMSGRDVNTAMKSMGDEQVWANKSAAEIARFQAARDEKDEWETLEEFTLSKGHGIIIAEWIERFEEDPEAIRRALRVLPGLRDRLIGEVFALAVFLADEFVVLCGHDGESEATRRFFEVAAVLSMDMQMVLCNRVFGSAKELVLSKNSEPAFQKFAKIWNS